MRTLLSKLGPCHKSICSLYALRLNSSDSRGCWHSTVHVFDTFTVVFVILMHVDATAATGPKIDVEVDYAAIMLHEVEGRNLKGLMVKYV
jgi:hypothetical protein